MPARMLIAGLLGAALFTGAAAAQTREAAIIAASSAVLDEVMTIPARQIPESLLADAYGVAIIPDVIKIGFVGGVQRGRGVVLVRDENNGWTLPKFITLTGGSIGWQAGAQATDVILVFRARKSVDGLLNGKFTLGADAAIAAGPVGRRAEAATDAKLKAEILSYSRSRGLFAGVSLGGSVLNVDAAYNAAYYRPSPGGQSTVVPEPAVELVNLLARLTAPAGEAVLTEGAAPAPQDDLDIARQAAVQAVDRLYVRLDDRWKAYFALPANFGDARQRPDVSALNASLARFDGVAQDSQYQALWQQPEFKATHQFLQEYVRLLDAAPAPKLALPPPPNEVPPGKPAQR
ncbi:MAG TPA: lipid-binding SYLF domain-containing protein [Pirellulales bacterium]|nr:lipid-binding SYLF domain-containing protein [Pirellulales bacterium]